MRNDVGQIIALPFYTDCGVMYYRKDLLDKYEKPVPKTWEELYETALYIQNKERKNEEKKNIFYGLVFQAKAFEILTCNFVEFVDSFGGAVVKDGNVEVNSPSCLKAILFMIKCGQAITSRSVLNYSEEDARGAFQSGNAVFMRNWPYAWALLNDETTAVAGKVAVMPIPPSADGGKQSGVLGGWFLGVSRYSKHSAEAADLVRFISSKKQQKARAKYSYLPTYKSLYQDPDILEVNPFFKNLYDSLQNAVTRPSIQFGKNYPRASSNVYNCVNTMLAENIESKVDKSRIVGDLNSLKRRLDRLRKGVISGKAKNNTDGNEGFWHDKWSSMRNFLSGILKRHNGNADNSRGEIQKKTSTAL
jgi:trehalose/maltose transport system substrate-binding protein